MTTSLHFLVSPVSSPSLYSLCDTGDASELRWTQVAPKKEISSDSGDAGNPLHAEPTCVFTIDEILDGDPSLSLYLSLETICNLKGQNN